VATGTAVADKIATADGVLAAADAGLPDADAGADAGLTDADADADAGAVAVGLLDADAGAVAVAACEMLASGLTAWFVFLQPVRVIAPSVSTTGIQTSCRTPRDPAMSAPTIDVVEG
jgi:hypothetical protein